MIEAAKFCGCDILVLSVYGYEESISKFLVREHGSAIRMTDGQLVRKERERQKSHDPNGAIVLPYLCSTRPEPFYREDILVS